MQKSLLLDLQDSHFAILLPDRGDLAATYLALKESGMRFDGLQTI
jgi:catechol-2,3-dioxygenase